MINVRDPVERAVLVAAPRKGSTDAQQLQEHLDELAELVDTAGAAVAGRLSQNVASPNPATLIGEGKVEELRAMLADTSSTLAIFDEELSPVQGANLEKELKVRVMDRAELILDIFSTRARSHEAKLQVELAQLQYMLPRLARMWTHLSRIRGGIGLRGPGETQLETDRRMIRKKIQHLKKKLGDVAQHRETVRSGRQAMLSAALGVMAWSLIVATSAYAHHVEGQVKCPNGTVYPGVRVVVTGSDNAFAGSVLTDLDGLYNLSLPTATGNYDVSLDPTTLPPGATVPAPVPIVIILSVQPGAKS
jgi:hypothetical protein